MIAFSMVLPVAEVTERAEVTRARFANHRAPRFPLVFRGFVADWPARNLDFPRIVGWWPKRSVRAAQTAADGFTVHELRLSPDDIVQQLEGKLEASRNIPPDWRFDVVGEVPELAAECPPPRIYHGRLQYQIFMGRDTVTRTHYHAFHHALICQVHGDKRVRLCSPDDSRFLYAHAVYRRQFEVSRVDPASPDVEMFPKFSSAKPLEALLRPGDALFIPLRWWHAAFGVGSTMSASLFWKAHWREQVCHGRLRDFMGTFFWNIGTTIGAGLGAPRRDRFLASPLPP